MIVGVISDTHGLLRPEAVCRLAGVHHIIHAGDIGSPHVIAELEKIAPVTAIKGNIDTEDWAIPYPDSVTVTLADRAIHVLHNQKDLTQDPAESGFHVVISGHSHQPEIKSLDGVLYLNPGSAGPRRFALPIAVATLALDTDTLRPSIYEIVP
jgi:putative phosphoesterase